MRVAASAGPAGWGRVAIQSVRRCLRDRRCEQDNLVDLRQSVWSLRRRRILPDPLVIVLAHDGVAPLIAVVAAMKVRLLVLSARIPIA